MIRWVNEISHEEEECKLGRREDWHFKESLLNMNKSESKDPASERIP